MKRFVLLVALVLVVFTGGAARAASEPRMLQPVEPMRLLAVAGPGASARVIARAELDRMPAWQRVGLVWRDGFRINAGRAPDDWIDVRRARLEVTPGQVALGVVLGAMLLLGLGAAFGSLALHLKPRGLTWRALTRPGSQEILGRS